jgi:hypothetical protein
MTERQLADLLRHIDDDDALDGAEIAFKIRLRADLDETLDRDRLNRARLVVADASPQRNRSALLAAAAAVILVVAGALIVAERTTSDAPASPIPTAAATSTTTVPVLDAWPACERFRASNADELLVTMIPDDLTVAEMNEAVDAIDVLLADVEATYPDDPFHSVLVRVRDATREAALRLEVDDRAGARTALEAARIDSQSRLENTQFVSCLNR